MFTLSFETGNDAFAEAPELEIARILGVVRLRIVEGHHEGKIVDLNGTSVGTWSFEDERE